MARGREESGGRPVVRMQPVTGGLSQGGVGGRRGQGAGKPLSPAARRAGDQARMPGRSRNPRQKKRKAQEFFRSPGGDHVPMSG